MSKAKFADDARYLEQLLTPLSICANYKPKFGTKEKEISLDQFKAMYGADPFYHWIGLDSELMYSAHKAAGGMTSIYRQLGIGCEALFRTIIRDQFELTVAQVAWTYDVVKDDGKKATLTLDSRIDKSDLTTTSGNRQRVEEWLGRCGKLLEIPTERLAQLQGPIFEIRQGYKSADAKRQNADLRFGMNASVSNYMPVIAIVSTQASMTVISRYRSAKMLVLTGTLSDDDTVSTYAFFKNVVQFSLEDFFSRNSVQMKKECAKILEKLLSP